jgi:hypothetical protein
MEAAAPGELVTVADDGVERHGIVFDVPSRGKVVVAVVHGGRGPVFRTFHPRDLTERSADAAEDAALRLLIRRTPPPAHGGGAGRAGVGHERAGHTRGTMHRTTGK